MIINRNYVPSTYSSFAERHQIILYITGFFCLPIEMLPDSNVLMLDSNQMFRKPSGDTPDF